MQLNQFRQNYNPYYDRYLNNLNPNENGFERLKVNSEYLLAFFDSIDENKMEYSYADAKWTIAQILQHIIDTERIFCYRALKIVREENPNIETYNHDIYAKKYKYKSKNILLNDYSNNRNASISLFKTFDNEELNTSLNLEHYKFKVGLIPFICCGHELHHLNIIKENYF